MHIREAFYIKLGASGRWADESLANGKLRLGWEGVPLGLIHSGSWAEVRRMLEKEHTHKGTVTTDTERLKDLVTSDGGDVWITFHNSRMYWGRLSADPMGEDAVSKFRLLGAPWRDTDLKGRLLLANQIPGRIAQLQGFRGTVCRVAEKAALTRLLNGETSAEYDAMFAARSALVKAVVRAIQHLHWRDFEVLVDLVFRQAGWRRRSILGKAMKFADLELEAPITREAYQVQVKSRADEHDFATYIEQFDGRGFQKLYFVVHSPTPGLARSEGTDTAELILPGRLAELVVDHGLAGWLMDKVR